MRIGTVGSKEPWNQKWRRSVSQQQTINFVSIHILTTCEVRYKRLCLAFGMALVTFWGIVASWDKSKWYSDGCRSLFLVCDVLSVSNNFWKNIIRTLLETYRISSSYQINHRLVGLWVRMELQWLLLKLYSICYKPSGNRSLDPKSISRTQEEENVNFNYRSAFEYRSVNKSLNSEMRRVIRSNKSHGTSKRWNGTRQSRDRADPKLLLIGEREMQFMNTKFEKQMMHVKNFINLYLTSIASIWVIWIIWLLNLISHWYDIDLLTRKYNLYLNYWQVLKNFKKIYSDRTVLREIWNVVSTISLKLWRYKRRYPSKFPIFAKNLF